MVICISFDGLFVSLNIACNVRRCKSVKTSLGFFGVRPFDFPVPLRLERVDPLPPPPPVLIELTELPLDNGPFIELIPVDTRTDELVNGLWIVRFPVQDDVVVATVLAVCCSSLRLHAANRSADIR